MLFDPAQKLGADAEAKIEQINLKQRSSFHTWLEKKRDEILGDRNESYSHIVIYGQCVRAEGHETLTASPSLPEFPSSLGLVSKTCDATKTGSSYLPKRRSST